MYVLLAHASIHGSSAEIAEYMAQLLNQNWMTTAVSHVDEITSLTPYDAVILGAPIHTGMWAKPMLRFLIKHQRTLQEKNVAAWLTCIRLLEADGLRHVQQEYVVPELQKFQKLAPIGIFAGKLDINTVSPTERWILNARYDGARVVDHISGDFRNWNAIQAWTMQVVTALLEERVNHPV
jgi:menaquinone-dependent protoporphyrinogen oxidase